MSAVARSRGNGAEARVGARSFWERLPNKRFNPTPEVSRRLQVGMCGLSAGVSTITGSPSGAQKPTPCEVGRRISAALLVLLSRRALRLESLDLVE